ncbi:hypothetical protein R1sor_013883 [Riccia sorocarpa]|uniref:Ribulose bisphosphate carboxylase small subunit n=1 Tax=Riccia sorocarpa TaxID=122646 RepID=A0ABD3HE16_9MARC
MASTVFSFASVSLVVPLSTKRNSSTSPVVTVKAFAGLERYVNSKGSEWQAKTMKNGSRVRCMQVWNPNNNLKFETLSYLPPLNEDEILKQIDYLLATGCTPCLEFDVQGSVTRVNSNMPGYYDGRYWTMWKLPMFGCTDSSSVLREIQECKELYGDQCYIRVMAFDKAKQVQRASFLVHKP